MDTFRALIVLLLLLLVGFSASAANVPCYRVGQGGWQYSASAACSAFAAARNQVSPGASYTGTVVDGRCMLGGKNSLGHAVYEANTIQTGSCAAPPEPEPEPPRDCPSGGSYQFDQSVGSGAADGSGLNWVAVANTPSTICTGGCSFSRQGLGGASTSFFVSEEAGEDGSYAYFWRSPFTGGGESCSEGGGDTGTDADFLPPNPGVCHDLRGWEIPCQPVEPDIPAPLPGGSCPEGLNPGEVNGTPVCVPGGGGGGTGEVGGGDDGGGTGGDGGGTGGDGGGTGGDGDGTGGDGDGTGGDGDGGGTGGGGGTKPGDETKPPDSSWGGGCGGFSCTGDAVQCAIAREIHEQNCNLGDTKNPQYGAYEGAAGEGQENVLDRLPADKRPSHNVADMLDSTDPLGGGSCPADFPFTVMGQTFTLPLAQMCPWLKLIGNIAVICAYLAAARIILGGAD